MIRNATLATPRGTTRPRPTPPPMLADTRPTPPADRPRRLHAKSGLWVWVEPDAACRDWFDLEQVPALVLDRVRLGPELELVRVRTADLREAWVDADRVGVPCRPEEFRETTWAAMRNHANRVAATIAAARDARTAATPNTTPRGAHR